MADPTLEDDSLISQDDIDKLMDSSSIEEVEDNFSSDGDDGIEDLGELSQEDIDRLMNSSSEPAEDPLEMDDIDDDDMELISQSDIDQLMNPDDEEPVAKAQGEDDPGVDDIEVDDVGELSQDDIDRLMNGGGSDIADNSPADPDEPEDLDDDFEMISQEDINSLMESSDEDLDTPATKIPEPVADEVAGRADPEAEPDPVTQFDKEENPPEDDFIIDESEAVDVQDTLIDQAVIDDLINNFGSEPESDPEPDPEPVVLDEPAVPESDTGEESEISDAEELEEDDDFLTPVSGESMLEFEEDEEENDDVSQEDIDALLLDEDDEDDDDILISQDDIDTLLMAADQEDEDVLGDLMDDEPDSDLDDAFEDAIDEDEDFLEDDGFDEAFEDDETVVLEGDDDPSELPALKKDSDEAAGTSKWFKSKLVIASLVALLVLGITVPAGYFLFFSGGSEPQPEMVSVPIVSQPVEPMMQREIEVETVDIDLSSPPDFLQSGNLVLEDFVVMASDQTRELTYITADISIDYSDQRAYHEIISNLSFYRDLIYDAINKSLVSERKDEITEADILWIVEATLKRVLPGRYIDRVSFKSFTAS